MITKRYIIVQIILIVLSINTNGQNTPDEYINAFFEEYQSKTTDEAFDSIFATNSFVTKEDVGKIKNRVNQYKEVLGKYHDKELLIKKDIGESIEVHSYMLKYDRQPIRFIFTFYKPGANWKIYNFRLSDDFLEEIENATIKLSYEEKP